jgi:hypothetical protein
MKRILTIFAVCLILSGTMFGGDGIFEIKGLYFNPTEQAFKDIYGSGPMFGGEITAQVWRNAYLWVGGSFYTKKGKLTYTEEETKIQLIPLGVGVKFLFGSGNIDFYAGGGVNYFLFKETNVLGNISDGGLGFCGKAGLYLRPGGGLVFDLFADYSYCKIEPADFKINIGGLSFGIGLGYQF